MRLLSKAIGVLRAPPCLCKPNLTFCFQKPWLSFAFLTSTLFTMPVPTNLTREPAAQSTSLAKNIWIAAGEGDLDRVKECVEQEGVSVTAADAFTYTPLHAAASYGHLDILRYLLSHPSAPSGAVNTTDSDGDTPLFVCESVEAAKCLVEEFHADASHKNNEGLTPAQQATENESEDVAAYLRSVTGEAADAPVDDEDDEGSIQEDSGLNAEQEEHLEAATDQLMARVEEIMTRSEREGFDPEEELRTLVSDSVLRQMLEGMDRPPPPSEQSR